LDVKIGASFRRGLIAENWGGKYKPNWRKTKMAVISMKQLLEAGVHFGHQTRRWNPKMKRYIFTERNGIYIIDLQKTVKLVDDAYNYMHEVAENGGIALFVGTKKQAQDAVKDEAIRSGQYYVNHRWLGGTLTNWDTIQTRIKRLKKIKEMQEKVDVEIEAFIHGAMCISYSGRCVLSNHMVHRDANRGGCAQSCRWKYGLFDMPFAGEKNMVGAGEEGIEEKFSMSAVDLAMIQNLPDLIEAGVDSLKIEGRMKSIHYVSTVSNVYRAAVDSYCEDPDNYVCKQEWIDELWKAAQRELATGFYYQVPTEHEQLFGPRRQIPQYAFVGQVLEYDPETQMATVQQRNNFKVGDQIEFYGPGMRHHEEVLTQLWDENGEEIEAAPHAMMICKMKVTEPVKPLDMIRKRR